MGQGFLYHGDIVGVEDGVPSAQDCCRLCTALNVNATQRVCTVFNYCSQPGGCYYKNQQADGESVELEQGQCELLSVWQVFPAWWAHGGWEGGWMVAPPSRVGKGEIIRTVVWLKPA